MRRDELLYIAAHPFQRYPVGVLQEVPVVLASSAAPVAEKIVNGEYHTNVQGS